ncbi:MAG: aspartyl protease family protein [Terracidiphilus sp.]
MAVHPGDELPIAAVALAFVLVLFAALPAPAQQSAAQPDTQQQAPAAQPASSQPQQPGAGTQVQTGTSSGLTVDARIQNLLADHQYTRVAAQLNELPPEEAQLYRGVLANRSNDLKQSIALLEPLVDRVTASGDTAHEKLLREALAEDYLRLGDWAKAAKAYETLDTRLHAKLTPDEQDQIEMPLKLLPLAENDPPETVDPCDPFELQVTIDPLGLIDVPVFVDAEPHSWMLDPTLPFNLIARSTAKEVGLKLSDETATIHTLTGRPIKVHVTVVPRFTIGGRLTIRNMTAFVFDNADYSFPRSGYQVEGVLGYPALAAIGSLTVNTDQTIDVSPARQIVPPSKYDRLTGGVPFYLDGDQVIVALKRVRQTGKPASDSAAPPDPTAPAGATAASALSDDRMYVIDAGGQQTYLTSRYFDEHAAEFNNMKVSLYAPPGGSSGPQPTYLAETVPLRIGNTSIDLHYIRVLTEPLGSSALDDVYGVLGADALGQLRSYTFDYRTMRFNAVGQ